MRAGMIETYVSDGKGTVSMVWTEFGTECRSVLGDLLHVAFTNSDDARYLDVLFNPNRKARPIAPEVDALLDAAHNAAVRLENGYVPESKP